MRKYIKEIGSQSIIYTFSNILTKAIGFLLIPIYTRYLSTSDYGIISMISSIVGIFTIIFAFGMDSSWSRFYFDFHEKNNQSKKFFGNILLFLLVFGVIVSIVIILFGKNIMEKLFPGLQFYPYIFLSLFISYFTIFFNVSLNLYRIKKMSIKYGVFSVLKFTSSVLLIIFFVSYLKKGALGKLYAEGAIVFIFFIVSLVLLSKEVKLNFSLSTQKQTLKYGMPLIPHALASTIIIFADKFFLNLNEGLTTVGIYNIAVLFGSIMNYVVFGINASWSTFFMDIASKKGDDAKPIISQLSTYYIIAMSFIALSIILFSPEILHLMTTEEYNKAAQIIPIFVFNYLIIAFYYLFSVKLFYVKKSVKYIPIATFTSAIINVVLNYYLIPKYSMYGAAFATLISNFINMIFFYFLSQRFYHIRYEKRISIVFLITTLITIGYYVSHNIGGLVLQIGFKIILLGLFFLFLYVFQFFRKSEIENLKDIWNKVRIRQSLKKKKPL